jgi:hypothetical protein
MADHSSGSAVYSEDQKRRVVAFLTEFHRGPDSPTSYEDIQHVCSIKERALRQLISDVDGTQVAGWPFVLAFEEGSSSLWLATDRKQAEAYTQRLRHQIQAMSVRVSRREGCYGALGEPQGQLGL